MPTKSYKIADFVKIVALLILIALTTLLFFEIRAIKDQYDQIALIISQSYFNTVVELKKWSSRCGGIYVAVTEETPLSKIDDPPQDLHTLEGLELREVNAVYLAKVLAGLFQKDLGIQFKFASLRPLNPENAADPWEREKLKEFEAGDLAGKFEKVTMDGVEYYRYMKPLKIEKSCLGCHEKQGYRQGDIVGGVSVSLPAQVIEKYEDAAVFWTVARYLVFFVLIGVIILFFARKYIAAQEKLEEMAISDELTGLKNHRYLVGRLEEEVKRSQRYVSPLSVLFLDLDNFKQINDTHGHLAGDWILKRVGQILQESVRQVDIPGRYGGDEFVVILPETTLDDAQKIAERIRQKIENCCLVGKEVSSRVTASMGVAQLKMGQETEKAAENLLAQADDALYTAKKLGGNRVAVFEDEKGMEEG